MSSSLSRKLASRPPVASIFVGPALGTAPARSPWGFRHHVTSRRQSPTSAHARFRAGNREERGRTQHPRNPATLLLKSPQPAAWRSPRFSKGPIVASPPRKSHSESFVRHTRGPALGTAPASGGSVITGPRGASRPPPRTHALGPGTGKSGGEPSTLATLPRSHSKAPAASHSPRFSQVSMVATPPRKSHRESFVNQTRGPALGTALTRGVSIITGP